MDVLKCHNFPSIQNQCKFPIAMTVHQWLIMITGCFSLCSNSIIAIQLDHAYQTQSTPILNRTENDCSIQRHRRTVFPDGMEQLVEELSSCRMESIAVFTESDRHADLLLRSLASRSFVLIHYDISVVNDNRILELLRAIYVDQGIKNFILFTDRPVDVVSLAQTVFREHGRGKAALMPHRTKWTVIVWSESQLDRFVEGQRNCLFDNVAVWLVKDFGKSPVIPVRTLLWNQNRSRKVGLIFIGTLEHDCHSFPNRKFGFNGRTLHSMTNEFLSSDVVSSNKSTDRNLNSSGHFVYLMDLLAQSLNFSNSIAVTHVPWNNYTAEIRETNSDIGLPLLLSVGKYSNMDTSYPFVFGSIRGYYLEPRTQERPYLPTALLSPFPLINCVLILSALAYASFFYTLVDNAMQMVSKRRTRNNEEGKHLFVKRLFDKLFLNFCKFMPSTFNKRSLPNPTTMSLRVFVWLYALFTVYCSVMYTSYLTSVRVRPHDDSVIKTFEDLLKKDMPLFVIENSVAHQLLKASNDSILSQLSHNAKILGRPIDYTNKEDLTTVVISLMKQKHVFLNYACSAPQLAARAGPFYRVVFIEEILIPVSHGLALSKGSELNEMISDTISAVHENRVLHQIQMMRKHYGDLKFKADVNFNAKRKSVDLKDIVSVLIVIVFCVGTSFVVLGIEYVAWYGKSLWTIWKYIFSFRY